MSEAMGHTPTRNRAIVERVFATGHARLCMTSEGWDPCLRNGLEMLAYAAADYCHAVAEARAERPYRDPAELAFLRIEVRHMMAAYLLLPQARIIFGEIRADGLDVDIARLCGVDNAS